MNTSVQNQQEAKLSDILLSWYDKERRILPWREDPTPYHVWVSEIMLQQTRVDTVIEYYQRFLRELPDVKALAEATKTLNENEAVYFQKSLDFLDVMIQNAEFTDPEEAWFQ